MFLVVMDVVFTSSIILGALTLAAIKYTNRKNDIQNTKILGTGARHKFVVSWKLIILCSYNFSFSQCALPLVGCREAIYHGTAPVWLLPHTLSWGNSKLGNSFPHKILCSFLCNFITVWSVQYLIFSTLCHQESPIITTTKTFTEQVFFPKICDVG